MSALTGSMRKDCLLRSISWISKKAMTPERLPQEVRYCQGIFLMTVRMSMRLLQRSETRSLHLKTGKASTFFVTDSNGDHVVIESRNGKVTVTDSDIITNFYLSYDDAEDSYRKGELREGAIELTDENGDKLYHFGYGHGYNRFNTIASQLHRYLDPDYETYRTKMPETTALVILESVTQKPIYAENRRFMDTIQRDL